MKKPPKRSGDLAAYEFYIETVLSWQCGDCGTHIECTNDIRVDEPDAPYGGWAARKAREAMNEGWYVEPLTADGSLAWSTCYCPRCAKERGLIIAEK